MPVVPVCQITTAGCIRPDFAACLSYIQTAYRGIYGQDIYLGADCRMANSWRCWRTQSTIATARRSRSTTPTRTRRRRGNGLSSSSN